MKQLIFLTLILITQPAPARTFTDNYADHRNEHSERYTQKEQYAQKPVQVQQSTLYIGPSLGVNTPSANMNSLGGSLAFLFPIPQSHFSLGFETGYWVYQDGETELSTDNGVSTVTSEVKATARTIPILLASQFEFTEGALVPYFGLGVGVGSISATFDDNGNEESANTTKFMMLAKPGLRASIFFVEPKVALIGGDVAFLPTLGLALKF